MKPKHLPILLTSLSFTFFLPGNAPAQPPPQRKPPTSACPVSISGISDCPDEGCGENGDTDLNQAKNRLDVPNDAAVKRLTFTSMRKLPQPLHWSTGDNRASLRTPGKEGTPVQLQGFLLLVKPGGGESCNCDLTRRVNTDVHLVLVHNLDDPEESSVTAEVGPRGRAHGHPEWQFKNLNDLQGEFVRVTGWLMLDTKHIRQTHFLPNEGANKSLKRSTNWEVHPITRLEVCQKPIAACNANQGWEEYAGP